MKKQSIIISIAGIPACFRTGNHRLAQSVKKRYRGYLIPRGRNVIPFVTIECSASRDPVPGPATVKLKRTHKSGWIARRRDFFCEWNGSNGIARLTPCIYAFDSMLRVLISTIGPEHGLILLHAASAAGKNGAVIFPGKSGCGKTTISRIIGRRVLNDEITGVQAGEKGNISVYGTPFWGEMGTGPVVPQPYILRSVYFPVKSRIVDRREPVSSPDAVTGLMKTACFFGKDAALAGSIMEAAFNIASTVPAYRLYFTINGQVAGATDI